jgi:hypothetical protein
MKNKGQFIKGLPILLILLALLACRLTGDNIEDQDIVGVWVEDNENCKKDINNCSWFDFMEDGYFVAINLPQDYFGYFPHSPDDDSKATGTWDIALSSDPLGLHRVRIRFDANPDENIFVTNDTLYVEGETGDFILYGWHEDPSNRIEFIKLPDEH